jgi:hypothetical protein
MSIRPTTRASRRRSCCPISSSSTPPRCRPGFSRPGVVTDYTGTPRLRERHAAPRSRLSLHRPCHGYVTYSRGFKSGGFDMRGNAAVYPQTENGYGLGDGGQLRGGHQDRPARRHAAAQSHRVLRSVQKRADRRAAVRGLPGCADQLTAVLNAGKQINQGVEIESVWRPTQAADVRAQRRLPRFLLRGFSRSVQRVHGRARLRPASRTSTLPTREPADQRADLDASGTPPTRGIWLRRTAGARGYDWRSFTKVANTTPSVTDQPAYGCSTPASRSPRRARRGASRSTARTSPTGTTASPATTSAVRRSGLRILHRRPQPDRLLWPAAHVFRNGDVPFLKVVRRTARGNEGPSNAGADWISIEQRRPEACIAGSIRLSEPGRGATGAVPAGAHSKQPRFRPLGQTPAGAARGADGGSCAAAVALTGTRSVATTS